MITNNNEHIVTNEIVWIRQLLFFSHVTFLSLSEVSVASDINLHMLMLIYQIDVFYMNSF